MCLVRPGHYYKQCCLPHHYPMEGKSDRLKDEVGDFEDSGEEGRVCQHAESRNVLAPRLISMSR